MSFIRTRIATILALFALIAGLTVVAPTFVPDLAPQAQAVSQKCKNRTDRHTVRFVHSIGSSASPDYVQKAWLKECPKSEGDKVWKIGGSYRFPRGTEPCNSFTGTKIEMDFYPGGYHRSFIVNCDGRANSEKHSVDIFVPEKLAPPQPGLERTVDVRIKITGMWNQGKGDHEKTFVFFYRY